jgi:hypothetical protein
MTREGDKGGVFNSSCLPTGTPRVSFSPLIAHVVLYPLHVRVALTRERPPVAGERKEATRRSVLSKTFCCILQTRHRTSDSFHSRQLDLHMPHSMTTAQHDRRFRRRQYYLRNRQRALSLARTYYRKHRVQVCMNSRRRYAKLKALYAAHMAVPRSNGASGSAS